MPRACADGVEIEYEDHGDEDGVPLLLVSGLGSQMLSWDVELVESFVDRGFRVLRFDNRDVGLSTKFEPVEDTLGAIVGAIGGDEVAAPYRLTDMAGDAVLVLDHAGIDRAHVMGVSMGGMIAQTVAIEHRPRVLSLTSVMSSTGDPDVGAPRPDIISLLLQPTPADRGAAIAAQVDLRRAIGSPEHFEADRALARATQAFDRCFHPQGTMNQVLAIAASPSRSAALGQISIEALVIHGDADPLVDVSGGHRTAEVLSGSELVVLEGMGHDLPSYYWPPIIESVTTLAVRSAT
jgi:pimeloyl-ACP methyl ester carboxylesterase